VGGKKRKEKKGKKKKTGDEDILHQLGCAALTPVNSKLTQRKRPRRFLPVTLTFVIPKFFPEGSESQGTLLSRSCECVGLVVVIGIPTSSSYARILGV
jgi:hypothetical protein